MLFKSQIASMLSGSTGGVTASHNRYGRYFRSRVIPTNPNTNPQAATRQNFANLSLEWKNLTDAQRTGWKNYANTVTYRNALGEVIKLQGNAMMLACLTPRRLGPVPALPTQPPTTPGKATLTQPSSITLSATTGLSFSIETADPWVSQDDSCLLVSITQGQSTGVSFNAMPYRFFRSVLGSNSAPPTNPITTPAANIPFPLVPGRVYFLKFVVSDAQQRRSDELERRVVCTA